MAGAAGLGPDFPSLLRNMSETGEGTDVDPVPMRQALEFLRQASAAAGMASPV